jgi:acyl dehydratase
MAGLWLDEFVVGQVIESPLRRTLTETDNLLMSTLTHNPAPLHLDAEYMKESEFGRILVNSFFTLGLMVGISINDTTQGTTIANLGLEDVRFPAPLFVGDTIRVTTEILAVRESATRPTQGILTMMHRAYNQHGVLVAQARRMTLQKKRPAATG